MPRYRIDLISRLGLDCKSWAELTKLGDFDLDFEGFRGRFRTYSLNQSC